MGRARDPGSGIASDALGNLDWEHVNRQLRQAEAAREGASRVGAEPKREEVRA